MTYIIRILMIMYFAPAVPPPENSNGHAIQNNILCKVSEYGKNETLPTRKYNVSAIMERERSNPLITPETPKASAKIAVIKVPKLA